MELFRLFGSVFIKNEASAELGKIEKEADKTANKFESMGKSFGTVGKKATEIGKSLTTKVSLPIVAMGGFAVKSAMDFQSAMSEVSALSGATGSDLDKLGNLAREMGAKTVFSAKESAEGLKYMALAGWDTNQMAAGLEPMLLLAGAAGMELATASDIVTDTLSMFGMKASEATKMTDMLAYAQANSNTDVEGLAEALKYAGSSANAMGYDLADTVAILGLFADQGLKGSIAGTTLNSMFRDMKKNAKDGAIAVGDKTVAIVDANGNYRDMADIMTDVELATKDMTQAERDMALSAIFGTEAMKGVNMILEAGTDSLKNFEDGIRSSDGASKEMYDTMQNNLKGAFENLKSALGETAISFGTLLIPYVQQATEWLIQIVEKFNGLNDGTKLVIVGVLGLVAAIGPLLLIFGTMATSISSIITLYGTITTAMAGAGLASTALGTVVTSLIGVFTSVIAPIMAVIAALVLLYKNSETFRDGMNKVFESVKNTVKSAMDFITTVFKSAWDVIIAAFNVFKAAFSGDWNTFAEALKTLAKTLLKALQDIFKSGLDLIGNIVKVAFELIKTIINTVFTGIKNIVKTAWDGITKLFETPLKAIQKLVETVWKTIEKVFTLTFKTIEAIVKTGMTLIEVAIRLPLEVIRALFLAIWEQIGDTVKKQLDKIKNVINTVFNAIKSTTTSIWNSVKSTITSVINSISSTISSVFNTIKGVVTSAWNSISSTTSSIWNNIRSSISNVVSGISSNISSTFNSVRSSVTGIWNGIKNAITNPMREAQNAVQNAISRIKSILSGTLSFPKIRLPRFKINGSFSLNPPSVPSIGVDWYKKGGIMTNPTAFGFNPITGNVMAGGEAGAEAILPLNRKTLAGIGYGIADTMQNKQGSQNIENNFNIASLEVREEADIKKIAQELFNMQQRSNRGRGLSPSW